MGRPLKILLDSVILIDHFNGVAAATAYLHRVRNMAAISVVTRAEVLTGFTPPNEALARPVIDTFSVLTLDREAADLAAQLRREHRWKLPDAFQAALAQIHKLQLATRNVKDFPPEKFSFVTVPYGL